jgi:apolipoprotein D and lipocalin family protein
MSKFFFLYFIINALSLFTINAQALQTVPFVDLNKYAGTWYEIAAYPQRFQKGCHCTSATYTLSNEGDVIVENRCNRDSILGKTSYIKGKAFVEPGTGNAKLKVQFFWPFKAKYWIIDLAEDYSYAVISPNKKYLWILSRTTHMQEDVYNQIIARIQSKGFDITKLKKTIHP